MTTLGVDTSNYTTSCSICEDGRITENIKLPLPVESGRLGLRQSDAVFLHTKALPQAFERIGAKLDKISAIGVSTRPRSVDGSYMPCFLVGHSAARIIASCLGVPLLETSHQDGHIFAAAYSAGIELNEPIYALHLSGGTLEILDVVPHDFTLDIEVVSQTLDLTAGQLIDRVGGLLSLLFPAGAALSELAKSNTERLPAIHPSLKGADCNLSGVYNIAEKYKKQNKSDTYIAAFVLKYIAITLDAMISELFKKEKRTLLFCGGVSGSDVIRKYFSEKYDACFATAEFSSDNAAGCALYAYGKMP